MADRPPAWIVAVVNQKGGVGKTTLALGLSAAIADSHGRALLVDVDPQASAVTQAERLKAPGFDVAHELDPTQLARLSHLRQHHVVFVDAPGSLEGRDVLSEVIEHAHFALLPFIDDPFTPEPTQTTSKVLTKAGVEHAAVLNRVDSRGMAGAVEKGRASLAEIGVPFFQSSVRQYSGYSSSLGARQTVYQWRGRYGTHIREDISRVNAELQRWLGQLASRAGGV